MSKDPVLETLFLPFDNGLIDRPACGPSLFLRARTGLAARPYKDQMLCEQSFKPARNALEQSGFALRKLENNTRFAMTLTLPPRQREEYRALLARAVTSTADGGIVMAAASNLEGAKTVEADLKALTGEISSLSKNKCRTFWSRIDPAKLNHDLIRTWLELDSVRPIENGRFQSRPGLFAWDRIDAGSKLLAANLPADIAGTGADLGAGFGYLTAEIMAKNPNVTLMDAYEAELRALDLARLNLKDHKVQYVWQDVTQGLETTYDFIVSNPPFHIDRADKHDLGKSFILTAAKALKPGGRFFMVANRHLPYEDTLEAAFKHVKVLADNGAYKVFEAKTSSSSEAVGRKPKSSSSEAVGHKKKPFKNSDEDKPRKLRRDEA